MKCLCGYEKIGYDWVDVPSKEMLYRSGKNKGKVKKIEPGSKEFIEVDPDKDDFYKIEIEKDFGIIGRRGEGWRESRVEIDLYACPSCGTLKVDI